MTVETEHALDTNIAQYDAPEKDLTKIGEIPPMGYVPSRCTHGPSPQGRHGNPNTPCSKKLRGRADARQYRVLVLVMARVVNYKRWFSGLR